MSISGPHRTQRRGQRPLWSGLVFGFLLAVFLGAFVYVAYAFVAWGQSAAAEAPDLPPLSLPRLVRSVADDVAEPAAPGGLFQISGNGAQEIAPQAPGRTTMLVMGLDTRPGAQELRTDSIILLTINPQTGSAGMLSIPRDMAVRAPILDRTVKVNTIYGYGRINRFQGGGPGYLRTTISELIGYPIDFYVKLNFDGFKQIIDQIGGIDIDVPKDILDKEYPTEDYGIEELYIPKGRQHMDGALALKYARTRNVDSDYGRAARQQQVIIAIKNRLLEPGQMSALLPRLPGLVIAMANSIQTDMPVEKAIALARALDQADLENVTQVVIDQKMGKVTVDPQWGYLLTPDMNKLRAAAAAIFADLPASYSPEQAARQTIQAEGARIVVLNGTQEKGLAARAQATLITDGFNVVAVGNADRSDYAETWLTTHGDRAPATVEALVQWYSIPPDRVRSEPPADERDITLIIGQDQAQAAGGP